MATQLMVDLYECDAQILNNENAIRTISKNIVREIGAEIVEECVRQFEPIGITYFAIISTSHFSVHTWPEHQYAAVDIFSCKELKTEHLSEVLKKYFKSNKTQMHIIEREVSAR